VPGCDGAGVVEAVGSSVGEFKPGDRVITCFYPASAGDAGDDAQCTVADVPAMLGQGTDGTLRTHAVFPETSLVPAPATLDWLQAATLTCNWKTAWNTLFGLRGHEAGPGSWVLVQGTGGVAVATLQLAVAAGVSVVATTSSDAKAERLVALGAQGTVNYRTTADWGAAARELTPGGRGFDIISDVGGNETLPQSFAAVRPGGIVTVVGGVGDSEAPPVPMFSVALYSCLLRGFLGGSRSQLRQVVQFIDDKKIKPVYDDKVFELADSKAAYRHLKEKRHFAKVVIRID
jgi:NADPH:quinone reductase-like Zn-dependent oxidoreductase